jgi:hypothetical protein
MGDAIATVPYEKPITDPTATPPKQYFPVPMYWIGEHDRVTLMTSEFVGTQALHHGSWFRGTEPDTIKTPNVTAIIRVIQSNPSTGVVTKYLPDVDFRQNAQVIEWLTGGTKPADGSFYTVLFKFHPVYTVYTSLPQSRDQDNQHFPRKVALRYNGVI